jgi:hypothetical protein
VRSSRLVVGGIAGSSPGGNAVIGKEPHDRARCASREFPGSLHAGAPRSALY